MKRSADKQSPWHIPTSVFISFPILFPSQIPIENNKDLLQIVPTLKGNYQVKHHGGTYPPPQGIKCLDIV